MSGTSTDKQPQSQPGQAQSSQETPLSPNQSSPDLEPAEDLHAPSSQPRPAPLQKRRRVTRACDECRRKKIKCDGKQPCTHCTVYSYGMILFVICVFFYFFLHPSLTNVP